MQTQPLNAIFADINKQLLETSLAELDASHTDYLQVLEVMFDKQRVAAGDLYKAQKAAIISRYATETIYPVEKAGQ